MLIAIALAAFLALSLCTVAFLAYAAHVLSNKPVRTIKRGGRTYTVTNRGPSIYTDLAQ